MYKLRSKVLALFLVLTLVFTSTGMVFGTETGFQIVSSQENAAEEKAPLLESENVIEQETVVSNAALNSGLYTTVAAIGATTILDSATSKVSRSYTVQPISGTVIPVVAQNTGVMYLDASNAGVDASQEIDVFLCETYDYATAADGKYHFKEWLWLAGGQSKIGDSGMPVKKGATYYITIENVTDSPASISVAPYVYTTEERSLSPGTSKWTIASGQTINAAGTVAASETWFKIKADKTGQMTVKLSEFDDRYSSIGYVTLYNSKKKALSDELYYTSSSSSYDVYFGVKKGTTYYLKVKNCYGDTQYKYGIQASIKKKTDRNLSSKKKAMNLKRKGKATDSLFVASTGKSTDWYKIKVTSKRQTVISIDTSGIKSGKVTVTAYKGSKKVGSSYTISAYRDKSELQLTYGSTYGKANAGTYYLKVVKDSKASGNYIIKYKK